MYKVLLFAGTAEGRKIAEYLKELGVPALASAATEYGRSLLEEGGSLSVSGGRMDEGEMERLFAGEDALVVDATHPYASAVTENIRSACEKTGRTYLRVLRSSTLTGEEDAVRMDSPEAAAEYLAGTEGNIFLTTGSKELPAFRAVPDYENRIFARVLPLPEVVKSCAELGFQGKHLICMQGPFSQELNAAMLRQTKARYLVTKDTGAAGGFPEKVSAAEAAGCRLVIIGRPLREEGMSLEECLEYLKEKFGKPRKGIRPFPETALVGIGMGGREGATMTEEARAFCRSADLLIGAGRMLESVPHEGKTLLKEYRPGEIAAYLREHPEFHRAAVLLSGDVGFYSGAKKLLEVLPGEIRLIPGISSLVYFCSRLKLSWEDVKITSRHGRESNLIGLIRKYPRVFSLLGKPEDVRELCGKLMEYGMPDVTVHVGERFTYPEEKIRSGRPEEFLEYEGDSLAALLVENPRPDKTVTHGIPDGEFLRDKVPMTKEEVREVSLSKLRLQEDSLIYDVGAGSGSVSVEMARMALEGHVWAVEKNPAAVELLKKNKKKFQADNLTIVEGPAPEALKDLPAPTHAFIGGSSGNLREIAELLLEKNPSLRMVVNAITLETLGEALKVMGELPFTDVDIVSVTAAKSRELGRYHMMMGQNPVYIISGTGGGIHEA